jgi:two-component system cell cycle sensor histidine kinase/response regulator CckA
MKPTPRIIQKLRAINPWHFVWITIILAEVFTLLMNIAQSLMWWGGISRDLLVMGTIDALVVSLVVSSLVIYFVRRTLKLEELNEQLQREIAERSRMQDLVLQAKNEWEETFNIITEAITVHDKDFTITRANKAAEELLGLDALTMTRKKCYELYHGSDHSSEHCPSCQVLLTGKPALMEIVEPHLNKVLQIRALPRFDKDNQIIGIVHVVGDITERVMAEKEQKRLQAQLVQAQKVESIGRLAGGVAHDFNNILSAIIGYSDLALLKLPENHLVRDYLKTVKESGERGSALTKQLLAFGGKQVLTIESLDLNSIIRNTAKMLTRVIGEDIVMDLHTESHTRNILADRLQMEQVLMNLMLNARDAMPTGGTLRIVTADVEIDPEHAKNYEGLEPGSYVLLTVSDTGMGMTKEIMEKIFEPFFTTKELGKGTGLGLATVYGIVKQHNGYIYASSEVGRGSTFRIYLPVSEEVCRQGKSGDPFPLAEGKETVLLVEDDPSTRRLLEDALQELGYLVIGTSSGEEALKASNSYEGLIDVLLTDVIMPNMNGKELAEAFSKKRPDTKVIFMTGYSANVFPYLGSSGSDVMLLQKPLTLSILSHKLREVLNTKP